MTRTTPELDGASVVMLGSFNPAIFQPFWFANQGLLTREEAADAQIEAVTPLVTVFSSGWVRVQVTTERFAAASSDTGHSLPLRDLILGTFRLLEHTPVRAMGINRQIHIPIPSEEDWHKVGDTLAPKELWSNIMAGRPGMRSLTVEGRREESRSEYVRVTVQPSLRVQPHGIYFDVNEHFNADSEDGLARLLDDLSVSWEESQNYGLEIAKGILASILTPEELRANRS